jgi:hypothetical protein
MFWQHLPFTDLSHQLVKTQVCNFLPFLSKEGWLSPWFSNSKSAVIWYSSKSIPLGLTVWTSQWLPPSLWMVEDLLSRCKYAEHTTSLLLLQTLFCFMHQGALFLHNICNHILSGIKSCITFKMSHLKWEDKPVLVYCFTWPMLNFHKACVFFLLNFLVAMLRIYYTSLYRLFVCDWFYIRQAYSVASIKLMEFYNETRTATTSMIHWARICHTYTWGTYTCRLSTVQ